MNNISSCIRCGKLRVEAKSWTEYIGESRVTYTQYVCPDSECQKIVESQLQKKKDKLESIQQESLKRRKETRRIRSKSQTQKNPKKRS